MKKYELKGGGIITTNNEDEFIEQLRFLSFNPGDSIEEFIIATANACYIQTGAIIRSNATTKSFIEDLIKNGFVREIE